MQKGDLIFFKSTSWVSRIITWLTRSQYSHVALCIGNGYIIEADRFVNTRIRTLALDDAVHVVYRVENVTEVQQQAIVSHALELLGDRYDYLQVFVMLLSILGNVRSYSLPNRLNYVICSELVDIAYYASGISRDMSRHVGDVTPEDLLHIYKLRKVQPPRYTRLREL